MKVSRIVSALALAAGVFAAAPVSAQFYLKSARPVGGPVHGDEPGIATTLPGATDAELQAGLLWNLRAGLNVAALQCQFEPSLLTVQNYNAVLRDHDAELKASYATLGKYFTRVNKSKAAGQAALDQFGTRTYSSFSTIAGQYNFCQTAGEIGREAIFAPRGSLHSIATDSMREFRNSLVPSGELTFTRLSGSTIPMMPMPNWDKRCWRGKEGDYNFKKCGPPVVQ